MNIIEDNKTMSSVMCFRETQTEYDKGTRDLLLVVEERNIKLLITISLRLKILEMKKDHIARQKHKPKTIKTKAHRRWLRKKFPKRMLLFVDLEQHYVVWQCV